jgi:DNA-binding response OmpR family regulator
VIHIASLPRTAAGPTARPLPREAGGGPAFRLDTVLVIEDDPAMRLGLGCMLADTHRQIVLAQRADEALEQLALVDPDVVVCDFLMEGMNGREFCQQMKAARRWRYVPIIMVTRMDERTVITDLLRSGADDVLVKPVRSEELRARVVCALRTRARYLELRRAVREDGVLSVSMARCVHSASI